MISKGLGRYLAAKLTAAPVNEAPVAAAPADADAKLDAATPEQLRDAVIQCFYPGAEPILPVLQASRKGLWSYMARELSITNSDMETLDQAKGYRVVQQRFKWSETIDVNLLSHPRGRGKATQRRRRLAVVTEDGVRVLYASQPPPDTVNAMLEEECREGGYLNKGK